MRSGLRSKPPAILAILAVISAAVLSSAQTPAYTTDAVLSKMDGVSKTFTGMEASIERVDFNNLAEDESRERGKIFFARKAAETRIRIDITAPREETILIDKGKLLVFSPKIKQLKERSLEGSQQHDLTEFLLVGFGQSSADIRKLYDPSVKGTEDINGKKTTILELKPKTGSSAAKEITSIVLWLDQNRWVPVRAKITQPSKDSTTVNYLDIKMGPAKDSAFNLEIPPKTKIIPF